MKKEIIAMILAGGQGSRLESLTEHIAKPAVAYGGKYRIIDFPLSNCANSGIDTVGVLTQYQPLELINHIGIGTPWDLDRKNGGVTILPPFMNMDGGNWYKGTANAVFQNRKFVDYYNCDYLLVLSGDHIYKMDYSKMLAEHIENNADATIAVIDVPLKEASRFGIMNCDGNKIVEFEEKPKNPKSTLASMGIYIFNWKTLKHYLKEDEKDPQSSNDFGKNIIPKMLNDQLNMFSYRFKGYWKDVGTVDSLWEANMDLLQEQNEIIKKDDEFKIYTVNPNLPPHYIGDHSLVTNSIISEGCMVLGKVMNSVLFPGVVVMEGVTIKDSIVMEHSVISEGSQLNKCIIGSSVKVKEKCTIGNGINVTLVKSNSIVNPTVINEEVSHA